MFIGIIGVTHVFVSDPTQGYGLYIDWMLEGTDSLTENDEQSQISSKDSTGANQKVSFIYEGGFFMECVLFGAASDTRMPSLLIESVDEKWRCTPVHDPGAAYGLRCDVLVLFPCEGTVELTHLLRMRPPVQAPYLVACGQEARNCDLMLAPGELTLLPTMIDAREQQGTLPQLCMERMPMMMELAEGLLRALELRQELTAWRFLPEMAAMTAVHPALLDGLSSHLYPFIGRQYGMRPAAVERSLRLAVESAWTRSSIWALERFFGQSIDPEKGKPTNREFLCQVCEHLTLAAQRLI